MSLLDKSTLRHHWIVYTLTVKDGVTKAAGYPGFKAIRLRPDFGLELITTAFIIGHSYCELFPACVPACLYSRKHIKFPELFVLGHTFLKCNRSEGWTHFSFLVTTLAG